MNSSKFFGYLKEVLISFVVLGHIQLSIGATSKTLCLHLESCQILKEISFIEDFEVFDLKSNIHHYNPTSKDILNISKAERLIYPLTDILPDKLISSSKKSRQSKTAIDLNYLNFLSTTLKEHILSKSEQIGAISSTSLPNESGSELEGYKKSHKKIHQHDNHKKDIKNLLTYAFRHSWLYPELVLKMQMKLLSKFKNKKGIEELASISSKNKKIKKSIKDTISKLSGKTVILSHEALIGHFIEGNIDVHILSLGHHHGPTPVKIKEIFKHLDSKRSVLWIEEIGHEFPKEIKRYIRVKDELIKWNPRSSISSPWHGPLDQFILQLNKL